MILVISVLVVTILAWSLIFPGLPTGTVAVMVLVALVLPMAISLLPSILVLDWGSKPSPSEPRSVPVVGRRPQRVS